MAFLTDYKFEVRLFCSFGDFGKGSFAAGSGVLFQEVFLDGLVVLGLDFSKIFGDRVVFKSLKCGFDVFFDLLIVCSALFSLACGLFSGFNDWH